MPTRNKRKLEESERKESSRVKVEDEGKIDLKINMDLNILNIGRFCCDPFGKHKKKVIKGTQVLTSNLIYRNPAFNLTTNHKACATCRSELAKAPSPKSACEEKALSSSSTDRPVSHKLKTIPDKNKKISAKALKKKNDSPVTPPLKYECLGSGPAPVPSTGKKYVGCHVSAAGGVWNCFANGAKSNASAMALFLRNQRSWSAKPLDEDTIQKWFETMKAYPRHLLLPHGSYLMNLGSPNAETLRRSRALFVEELNRCEKLGIPHFNFHPGSTLGEISREDCCHRIAESINLAHRETATVICVIENMSGQGYTVGGDFHEIRLIIQGVEDKSRVGVCIDTCHAHAAGYDLASEEGFTSMVTDFEKIIGWQFLRALHINDSKGQVGDHKDRHELIGKGYIGSKGFERIMNFDPFNDVPLILETPFVSEQNYAEEIKLLNSMIE